MSVRIKGREITAPMAWHSTRGASSAASWRTQRPALDVEKCTGCMICWKLCPEPAIEPTAGKITIHLDTCKGCGVCAHECPVDAIDMVPEEV